MRRWSGSLSRSGGGHRLSSGTVTAPIACPPQNPNPPNPGTISCLWPSTVSQGFNQPYRYLSIDNSGNRILASAITPISVAVITPSKIGTTECGDFRVPAFDRPVAAFFSSDDSTAYVVNCGAECGGTQASVQQFNLVTNTLVALLSQLCTAGTPNPQCAGSVALVRWLDHVSGGHAVSPPGEGLRSSAPQGPRPRRQPTAACSPSLTCPA